LEKSRIEGIKLLVVKTGPLHHDRECQLLSMLHDTTMPAHEHKGDEWGFVLQGEAQENNGEFIRPGDMVHHTRSDAHSFTVTSEEPFIAVVLHQGVIFE